MRRIFVFMGVIAAIVVFVSFRSNHRFENLAHIDAFEPYNPDRVKLPLGGLRGDEMFVYYAYVEIRDPAGPKIRILANVVCSELVLQDIQIDVGAGFLLPLERAKTLGTYGCRGGAGGRCKLQEMEFTSIVYPGPLPDEITIHRKEFSADVKLHRMPSNYKRGLNSCIIAPLFWTTKRLLEYYVAQGVVDVRPFPWMPYTDEYNPNDHTFYGAEHITCFFCAVWSDTTVTTMNDVDELFWARKGDTLLNVTDRLSDPITEDVGGLAMRHHALVFTSPMAPSPWDFEKFKQLNFLRDPIAYWQGRMGKHLYRTEYAKLPWIHAMREWYDHKRTVDMPEEQAVYLHMRANYNENRSTEFPDLKLFTDAEIKGLRETLDAIFADGPPGYEAPNTRNYTEYCKKMSSRGFEGWDCVKPVGTLCYSELRGKDEWLHAIPTPDSFWTPI
ncbi:unnamed protein product, partial [Mesorhabditis spiculigera]